MTVTETRGAAEGVVLPQIEVAWFTSVQRGQNIISTLRAEYNGPGLLLGLRPANESRRYKVTPSLTGWAQT